MRFEVEKSIAVNTAIQFGLIKKRRDIPIEQFHYHWREIHGPLGLSALPTVRQYIQNHRFFDYPLPGFPSAPYDGASEVFLNSLEDAIDLGRSKGYREVVHPDEANWLDSSAGHLIACPHVVIDSPPIPKNAFLVKALLLLKRKLGMRIAEFQDHWLNANGSIAAHVPGLLRYVQCHTAPESYEENPTFDGIAELWWKDVATFEQSWASPEMQDKLLGLRSILDEPSSLGMLVYEVRMLWTE